MVRGVERARILVEQNLCLLCAACTALCPTEALSMAGLSLEFESSLCNNCMLCLEACPAGAIKEDREEKR